MCLCVFVSPLQHLSPLELVKAARRASGDITDVGTADELWGSEDGCPSATVADSHHLMVCRNTIQWNPINPDTNGKEEISEVSLFLKPRVAELFLQRCPPYNVSTTRSQGKGQSKQVNYTSHL